MRQATMKITTLLEILAGNLHPAMVKVLSFVINLWPEAYIRITSMNRSRAENKAAGAKSLIHVIGPPWRSVDIGGALLKQEEIDHIADLVNEAFSYDPKRPGKYKVAYGAKHGSGKHLHLQVHDNTRRN